MRKLLIALAAIIVLSVIAVNAIDRAAMPAPSVSPYVGDRILVGEYAPMAGVVTEVAPDRSAFKWIPDQCLEISEPYRERCADWVTSKRPWVRLEKKQL